MHGRVELQEIKKKLENQLWNKSYGCYNDLNVKKRSSSIQVYTILLPCKIGSALPIQEIRRNGSGKRTGQKQGVERVDSVLCSHWMKKQLVGRRACASAWTDCIRVYEGTESLRRATVRKFEINSYYNTTSFTAKGCKACNLLHTTIPT
jgi:hypothetical protein